MGAEGAVGAVHGKVKLKRGIGGAKLKEGVMKTVETTGKARFVKLCRDGIIKYHPKPLHRCKGVQLLDEDEDGL